MSDDTALEDRYVFSVTGMRCAGCVAGLTKALRQVDGVSEVEVSLAASEAVVAADPARFDPAAAGAAADAEGGYGLTLQDDDADVFAPPPPAHGEPGLVRDAVLTVVLALLIMTFAMGWIPSLRGGFGGWAMLGCAIPVQFWCARRFTASAWRALRHGRADMDTLIAVGTWTAFLWSVAVGLGLVSGHAWFESAAMIVAFVLVGRALEDRAKNRAGDAVRSLLSLAPETARVERGGEVADLPLSDVRRGDVCHVRPGDRVPVDGVVLEGATSVDESMLTGESLAVSKGPGDVLSGGTMNETGAVRMRATRVGKHTALARIVAAVRRAQSSRAPVESMVDRVAAVFVPVVLVLALITLIAWLLLGAEVSSAVRRAVSVLVISCPCALGLATPTAVIVGVGRAARLGAVFRDARALEAAARADTVAFDKTGTLTEGRPAVREVSTMGGATEDEALAVAAAVEAGSEHPLASAVRAAATERGLDLSVATGFAAVPGRGVRATVEGDAVLVGSVRMLEEEGVDVTPLASARSRADERGAGVLAVARNNAAIALFAVEDGIREGTAATVASLGRLGLRPVMLTGDRDAPARAVAAAAGVTDVRSGLLPEDKVSAIEQLRAGGARVAMVGDGINDAPALATADVGVAMGTGTDVALETAHVALLRGSLTALVDALRVARKTLTTIRWNLLWAFFYNVLAIPVAAGLFESFGLSISPTWAAGAMALSSLTVVGNSLRLRQA